MVLFFGYEERFKRPPGYETGERSSLGHEPDRRQWREEGERSECRGRRAPSALRCATALPGTANGDHAMICRNVPLKRYVIITNCRFESCRPDQQCEPKKISVRKTQKPQRFLGFFVPFFKVEFKRYHFPKSTFGEDLN